MTTTQILTTLLDCGLDARLDDTEIEAEPAWFPKGQQAAEPYLSTEEGEAEAIIMVAGKRYCISLEELP